MPTHINTLSILARSWFVGIWAGINILHAFPRHPHTHKILRPSLHIINWHAKEMCGYLFFLKTRHSNVQSRKSCTTLLCWLDSPVLTHDLSFVSCDSHVAFRTCITSLRRVNPGGSFQSLIKSSIPFYSRNAALGNSEDFKGETGEKVHSPLLLYHLLVISRMLLNTEVPLTEQISSSFVNVLDDNEASGNFNSEINSE